jgi:hypothetical protein
MIAKTDFQFKDMIEAKPFIPRLRRGILIWGDAAAPPYRVEN